MVLWKTKIKQQKAGQVCVDNECPNQPPFISGNLGSLENMYMGPRHLIWFKVFLIVTE